MVTNMAQKLTLAKDYQAPAVTFGVCATGDPRVDKASRERARNIIGMVADAVAKRVKMPDGRAVNVVYSDLLIDGEKQADVVARQFRLAGVDAVIMAPDTWAFPQLTLISLLAQLPDHTPVNITCGNSGPKPGVVFAHAANGALAQSGRLVSLNVGTWPDSGMRPKMTKSTADTLVDWCYAVVARIGMRGRRVVVFGHDSMGMETALSHIIPTRKTFGLEITRLDMKLVADMLNKKAYDKKELKALRGWIDNLVDKRLEIKTKSQSELFDQSLAIYLVMRGLLDDLNAIGGGFMNQLEWSSDRRAKMLAVPDVAESLFNSTFDHNGPKPAVPFATEADMQGLITMLAMTYLSGGNPPLFMDFRKVWEPWEIKTLAKKLGVRAPRNAMWATKGFVDGDNSGSASFNWAAKPGSSVKECMKGVVMPLAEDGYFPGGGNSVTYVTPGQIDGIAARLAYCSVTDMFSMVWDEARTTDMPAKLTKAVCSTSNANWPHTFVIPKYARMEEYKQYAPANHFHMTWNLPVARLQYWMDLANVLSVTPWSDRPAFISGVDRPRPLLHLIAGGEFSAKKALLR